MPLNAGDFEQRGAAGSVVEGAVVNGVAVDGRADSEMVEVGGVDDDFVFELGVAAFEPGDNVGALHVLRFGDVAGFGGDVERKGGKRLAVFREREQFFGSVRSSLK
jgi:hypothetical protein